MTASPCLRVAFVDDETEVRQANGQSLSLAGFEPVLFDSGEAALAGISDDFAGVVVTDLRMPGIDGLELLRRLSERDDDLPVILISGHADVATAVAAVKRGAYDFLSKPYAPDQLVTCVKRALDRRALALENRALRRTAASATSPLFGNAPAIEALRRTITQIADLDVDVLIEGETGTGKGLVASMLHDLSHRRRRPMVTIDCGALSDAHAESELFGHVSGAFPGAQHPRTGRIEQANRGSLFLDDIDMMPDAIQLRLHRVFDRREVTPLGADRGREVDLRVVAASKVDLGAKVRDAAFSAPLFYRLNGLTLRLPPLRERIDDIPLLFTAFSLRAAARTGRAEPKLTGSVWRRLKTHDWPGNVRELQHYAEQVTLGIDMSTFVSLAAGRPDAHGLKERVNAFETAIIEEALDMYASIGEAVQALGLPRKTFYDKVQRLNIDMAKFRRT